MTCDYCTIDPAASVGVLTPLGHRVCLCPGCARRHGIIGFRRRRRVVPPPRDGPSDRQIELPPEGQT